MQTIDIFGRDNCGYCDKAKAYCAQFKLRFRYNDVRQADVRSALMGVLSTPPKTVPVIMVGKIEIAGGYEGLVKAHADGSLYQLIGGQ